MKCTAKNVGGSYEGRVFFYKGSEYEQVYPPFNNYTNYSKEYENVANNTILKIDCKGVSSGNYIWIKDIYIVKKVEFIQIPTTLKRGLPRDLETIGKKISTTLFGFHIDHTWYTGE